MAYWGDPYSRCDFSPCALCAWEKPKENLKDIRSFTETEALTDPDEEDVQVHDFCWKRLMKHFDHPPCLETLIRVLRETPIPSYKDPPVPSYWNGPVPSYWNGYWIGPMPSYRSAMTSAKKSCSATKEMSSKNIKAFIQARTTRRDHSIPQISKVDYETISQTDLFQRLPLEIRIMVAGDLSTTDFLSLRLSSKAMALLFESEQFWQTRFEVHGERGYMNFLTEPSERYKGWRLLYRCTVSSYVWPLKFNNWKKQWLTNRTIHDRYIMTGFEETGSSSLTASGNKLSNIFRWPDTGESIHWKRYLTICEMHLGYFPHCETLLPAPSPREFGVLHTMCKSCYREAYAPTNRRVIVSHPILKIRFSVLVENERVFITGFDLLHGSDIPDTPFGYRIPGKEILSDLKGQPLRGFQIKSKWPAILDISPITENNEAEDVEHDWVGDHESLAVYRERDVYHPSSIRVPSDKRNIVVISGHFLGRQLVGLAIGSVSDSSACDVL